MSAIAPDVVHMRETEDPILAALDRARLRPPIPEEERLRLVALADQATGPWQTTKQFMAKLAALRDA